MRITFPAGPHKHGTYRTFDTVIRLATKRGVINIPWLIGTPIIYVVLGAALVGLWHVVSYFS